jgi:hypothetical protein
MAVVDAARDHFNGGAVLEDALAALDAVPELRPLPPPSPAGVSGQPSGSTPAASSANTVAIQSQSSSSTMLALTTCRARHLEFQWLALKPDASAFLKKPQSHLTLQFLPQTKQHMPL